MRVPCGRSVGLQEAACSITMTHPDDMLTGHVGAPIATCEVRIHKPCILGEPGTAPNLQPVLFVMVRVSMYRRFPSNFGLLSFYGALKVVSGWAARLYCLGTTACALLELETILAQPCSLSIFQCLQFEASIQSPAAHVCLRAAASCQVGAPWGCCTGSNGEPLNSPDVKPMQFPGEYKLRIIFQSKPIDAGRLRVAAGEAGGRARDGVHQCRQAASARGSVRSGTVHFQGTYTTNHKDVSSI